MINNLNKINKFLIFTAIAIFSICIAYNIVVFTLISPPVFNQITFARVIGTDSEYIHVEIDWMVSNNSISSFIMSINEAHIYESGEKVGNVYFEGISVIKGLSKTNLVIRADIPRKTFERLMTNYIDLYSFHLIAEAKGWTLFFSKKIVLDQYLPIDVRLLINNFLSESLKNFISMENINFSHEQRNYFMLCNVSIYNRCQMDMYFRDFEGTVEVNNEHTGLLRFFEPIRFSSNETVKNTNLRFRFSNSLSSNQNIKYILKGAFKVGLWGRVYTVPVELMGEI